MQRQVITNIRCLANVRKESYVLRGKELSEMPCVKDAYLIIEDGVIADCGEMKSIQHPASNTQQIIDVTGATILPCWCDSHTHLVFAATREKEFIDKIKGKSYAEIAAKGGGI